MSEQLDCVVIGAGVVGLAIARSLAMSGRYVVVLEQEEQPGMHSSSRNSEVVHAGLYYPDDSLKAELCVAGNELLYAFCDEHRVPVDRIGKLIVAANDDEVARLQDIQAQASRNGVNNLQMLTAEEVATLEPALSCSAALLSPSSGVIDSHAYMLALQADVEAYGGAVVCNSEVNELAVHNDGFYLGLTSLRGEEFVCNTLINSAGHWAQSIARELGLDESEKPTSRRVTIFPTRALRRLVDWYTRCQAMTDSAFMRPSICKATPNLVPNVAWVEELDYRFDESHKADFVTAIQRYFPDLDEQKLVPAYTGIRPKLSGPGEAAADFQIHGEEEHGVKGLVNLYGIDSPGLTASLAIGEYVRLLLE